MKLTIPEIIKKRKGIITRNVKECKVPNLIVLDKLYDFITRSKNTNIPIRFHIADYEGGTALYATLNDEHILIDMLHENEMRMVSNISELSIQSNKHILDNAYGYGRNEICNINMPYSSGIYMRTTVGVSTIPYDRKPLKKTSIEWTMSDGVQDILAVRVLIIPQINTDSHVSNEDINKKIQYLAEFFSNIDDHINPVVINIGGSNDMDDSLIIDSNECELYKIHIDDSYDVPILELYYIEACPM